MEHKGFLITLIAMIALVGCGDSSDLAEKEEQATVVQLALVKSAAGESTFMFPAKVMAKTTMELSFRVDGRLQAVNLPEGQMIKQGQVLAKLDPKPFDRAVRMAEVRLKQAKLELERNKTIAIKGIGSEQSVDNAQVSYDLAGIDLENAKADLSYSTLRAPFNALVSKRLIENKGFIKAGAAIARLQDISRIHFKFDVPERVISNYSREQVSTATAYIDGAVDTTFDIEYVEHSTEPNPISQTYEVVYAMEMPNGVDITPGIRATVTISGDTSLIPQVLGVPLNAIMTSSDDKLYVWVFDQNTMRINKQQVIAGPMAGTWVAILSGLEKDQQVVSAGVSQMTEGLLVRPFVKQ
ncbi:MAG: RND family efflux transporter MFP subunit [Crocinitomicaceae bacterium]|jgi:RND family efflux transporter MFP subunit